MSGNIFGQRLKVMSFGESHGAAMGCVVDGLPAGLEFDDALLKTNLERRRPGHSMIVSERNELDEFEVLSGIYKNRTLGTPIAILVRNKDQRSEDYNGIAKAPRAGHADDVWVDKFGTSDPRGGGRSSGRETVSRVLAGSLAQMYVRSQYPALAVHVFSSQIAHFEMSDEEISKVNYNKIFEMSTRFPIKDKNTEIENFLKEAKIQGESYGGVATGMILNPPKSLGQPVFHKLKSDLAMALMSVGAVNGVEFGSGFSAKELPGTQFHTSATSVYGGIRGGISTGDSIQIRISVKPTSSILDTAKLGRHDPCILIRAIQVFQSMIYLTLADQILWSKTDRI